MANDRAGSFLTGLVLGGALGAALAILLAPRPGQETRQDLRIRGIDLKERAVGLAEEVAGKGRVAVEEQRDRLQQAIAEGKEAAAKTTSELMSRYEKAKQHPSPE